MTSFREFAEVFQKLEQISSNTALITILATFRDSERQKASQSMRNCKGSQN
jgi:hypothetical protein